MILNQLFESSQGGSDNYAENLAQKVFNVRPKLASEDDVLNIGHKVATQDLMSQVRANYLFARDQDFPSDFVSAYYHLQKQGLNEFALPGGGDGDSGRWYTDDELADIIGDDWFQDFDVSHDEFNIDAYGEKAKKNLAGYANSWFDDKGYNVTVMGVDHNDVDHDLKWYIVGSFHNPNFADKDVDEGLGSKLAGLGLAGAMALGSAGANARVTPDGQGGFTGGLKPSATVTAPADNKPAAEAPKGFSKEYLQKAADPNRTGRYMISVEKAQELLKNMQEGVVEGSQRVDSLVTDSLRIMKGAEVSDAVSALKTVLGDREYNGRRGHYNFYVKQILDMYSQQGVTEGKGPLGQGDLGLALKSLAGGWSGWHKEDDLSTPEVDHYEYDDGEGNYYGRGTIEHNLKTGEIKVEYHDSENDVDVDDTFHSVGDAMKAIRGQWGQSHGGKAPNFDRLGQRKQHGADDLRKTDRTGRKGTLAGGPSNELKRSIQWAKGKHGPQGVLPEAGPYGSNNPDTMSSNEYDRYQQDQMDYSKRDFKRKEHEAEWEQEKAYSAKLAAQAAGPWYIRLNGKLIRDKQGNPYTFNSKSAANKAAITMQSKLFNQGKEFMLTTNPNDKPQSVSESQIPAKLDLWNRAKIVAESKFHGANKHAMLFATKWYQQHGGTWKS